jgi:lambda repressor-like predicted transcriptional regulator
MISPSSIHESRLSEQDRLDILNLNAKHFHSLDALTNILEGDPAETWASTFHPDGLFQTLGVDGNVIFQARGRDQLINAHRNFPDIPTTRHWISNVLVEPHPRGARSGSYIIAMNIGVNPSTIIRTGTYDDLISSKDGVWLYEKKILILDAFSPKAE